MHPNRRPLTILVLEDEADLREAIGEALRESGHHLLEVDTVEHAREALTRHAVDVMLVDLVIRTGTSEELLAEFARRVAMVLTTADVTPRSAAVAAKYAIPLLLKPFDLDDLLPTVLRAHDERHAKAGV